MSATPIAHIRVIPKRKMYRVHIGQHDIHGNPEPDWSRVIAGGLFWPEARALISAALAPFMLDDCEVCREDALEARKKLWSMPPGVFQEEVDGTDYWILEQEA